MPRITFTATPKLPRDMAHLAYKQGDVVDLPTDGCERWIRRGVAVYSAPAGLAPAVVATEFHSPPLPHHPQPVVVAEEDSIAPAFDPTTSPIDVVRQFLSGHGRTPRGNAGEARLREIAADIVAAQ